MAALPRADRLVSSPLERCRRLAERIGAARGLVPVVDERLREFDFGTWEGVPWESIPRAELDAWAADFLHARPHGGESVQMLHERVAARHRGLSAQRRIARGRDPRRSHQGRSGPHRTLRWMEGRRRVRRPGPPAVGLIRIAERPRAVRGSGIGDRSRQESTRKQQVDLPRKPATVREPAPAVAQGTSGYSPTLVVPCRHSREGGNPVIDHASAEFQYKYVRAPSWERGHLARLNNGGPSAGRPLRAFGPGGQDARAPRKGTFAAQDHFHAFRVGR